MERTSPPTNGELTQEQKLQIYSELIMSRAALAARLGQQYGGDRDVYQALGYPDTIPFEDYLKRYERQDIARAVINRPVSFTWKGPLTITETGTKEQTALEKEFNTLQKNLQLKNKFIRLDKLSSVGDYGVLLLGFNDVKTIEEWQKPVSGNPKLLYVRPLHEGHAKIKSYITATNNPKFGLVEYYDVEMRNITNPTSTDESMRTVKVHYTRVIHIVPEAMESEVAGEPVLRSIYNRLMDLEKLVGGSAEMFWRGARPGYQAKIDKDFTLPKDVEDTLQAQFNEYEHNLRRFLTLEGIDVEALTAQVSDPANHIDVQIQMISAITGIPKRILTGSERGELSSDQDITSWYAYIQTRREEHAEVNIIRPFVDRMIELSILPKPSTGNYQIKWMDLFAASDMDQAKIGQTRATALKEYSQYPNAEMIIPPKLFRKLMLGMDDDEIELAEQEVSDMTTDEIRAIAAATPKPGTVAGTMSQNKKKKGEK